MIRGGREAEIAVATTIEMKETTKRDLGIWVKKMQ